MLPEPDLSRSRPARRWAVDVVCSSVVVKIKSIQIVPGPVQSPRIPIWRPVERAAVYSGICPIEVVLAQVGEIVEQGYRVSQLRRFLPPLAINLAIKSEELGPTARNSMERLRA
jgi:hypothetical protein